MNRDVYTASIEAIRRYWLYLIVDKSFITPPKMVPLIVKA